MRRKQNFIFLSLCLIFCFAASLHAEAKKVICLQKNGQAVVRARKCLKNETALDKAKASKTFAPTKRVGDKGPAGAKGPAGPKGPTGSPGSTKGFQGARGPSGKDGSPGARGSNGQSYYDKPRSGNSAFGVVGGDYDSNAQAGFTCLKFPFSFPLSAPLDRSDVIVKKNSIIDAYCVWRRTQPDPNRTCCNNEQGQPQDAINCIGLEDSSSAQQARCPGTAQNPLALPGTVCFYPTRLQNAALIEGRSIGNGFDICWNFDILIGDTAVQGVWVYTAP